MVCSVYQWSAESTKVIEPLKICVKNCDGLLSLPMVCWVYKTDWTTKNMPWKSQWSAQSTNGLLSLQNWLNHKKYALKMLMVCSVYQWSAESTKLIEPQKYALKILMVCSVYQWSAESTKLSEPLKISPEYHDGLLSLPMVCWVYKTDWTTKNMPWKSQWSAQSTNGLLSLQN